MAKDSSASTHQQTPHVNQTTHVNRTTRTATIIDALKRSAHAATDADDLTRAKIEALAEMICAGGDEAATALLVLMGKFQNSAEPKVACTHGEALCVHSLR